MKIPGKHPFIFIAITPLLLIASCNKEEPLVFDLVFGKEYLIDREGSHSIGIKDKIIFSLDGSYLRTEFTSQRDISEGTQFQRKLFFIDELKGNWKWQNGTLYLHDEEVRKCRCQTYGNTIEPVYDCNLSKDDIPFGAGEWYTGFTADVCLDGTVMLESTLSYRARTLGQVR